MNPLTTLRGEVNRLRDEQIRFLGQLVEVASDNPPGDCAPHASSTTALLQAMGFEVEQHVVPPPLVEAAGMISVTNLIVRKRFGDGPVIALNAHGDVVPPGAGWTKPPYGAVIEDGFMYGRGVAVSKSDFATYAFALRALIASGLPLAGTIELHFTYDEEAGGTLGPAWLIEQRLTRPDYAICAGFSYDIVVAHNGCLHLEIRVEGRSAHAARPDTGVDALEAATRVLASLYALRETYASIRSNIVGIEHPTLVVGLIEGGINTNVVPDLVTMRLDRRIIPEENPVEVEAGLLRHIAALAATMPGIRITTRRVLLALPFVPLAGQEKLVELLRREARAVTGEDVPIDGVPLYTDARHYSAAGIPTVLYGAGPHSLLEANGHRADEKLALEDLAKATLVVAATLAELLSPAATP